MAKLETQLSQTVDAAAKTSRLRRRPNTTVAAVTRLSRCRGCSIAAAAAAILSFGRDTAFVSGFSLGGLSAVRRSLARGGSGVSRSSSCNPNSSRPRRPRAPDQSSAIVAVGLEAMSGLLGAKSGNGELGVMGSSGRQQEHGTPPRLESWRDLKCLSIEDERELCDEILAHRRVQNLQVELEAREGRPVTVQEWAVAAGHASTHELFGALKEGRKAERKLILANQGLVRSVAHRYTAMTNTLTYDDLVQEGTLGLMQAVVHFDPTKGCRFSSYAVFRIKASILRSIANKDSLIRVPVHAQDTTMRLLAVERALQADSAPGAPAPTDAQLALALSIPEATVALYRRTIPLQKNLADISDLAVSQSVDMRSGGNASAGAGLPGGDQRPWGGEGPRLAELSFVRDDMLRVMRECLTPEELHVLRLRFGIGENGEAVAGSRKGTGKASAATAPPTFKEIGRIMEVSGEGIRRMAHRAIEKLQDSDEANGLLLAFATTFP